MAKIGAELPQLSQTKMGIRFLDQPVLWRAKFHMQHYSHVSREISQGFIDPNVGLVKKVEQHTVEGIQRTSTGTRHSYIQKYSCEAVLYSTPHIFSTYGNSHFALWPHKNYSLHPHQQPMYVFVCSLNNFLSQISLYCIPYTLNANQLNIQSYCATVQTIWKSDGQ